MNSQLHSELERKLKKKISKIEHFNYAGSFSKKYIIVMADGQKCIVKYWEANDLQLMLYRKLKNDKCSMFPKIVYLDNHRVIYEWINGNTVDSFKGSNMKLLEISKKTGLSLRDFHKKFKTDNKVNFKSKDIISCFNELLFKDNLYSLKVAKDYLLNNIDIVNGRFCSMTHGDLHMKNIVYDGQDIIFLDLDDMKISDPFSDFVYTSMHDSDESVYYYFLVMFYFDFQLPDKFWNVVKFYTIIKTLMMQNHISEISGEYTNSILNNVLKEFGEDEECIPRWYIEIEKKVMTFYNHTSKNGLKEHVRRLMNKKE